MTINDWEKIELETKEEIKPQKVEKIENFYIEEFDMHRNILSIDKFSTAPIKYPRSKNKPKTQPL